MAPQQIKAVTSFAIAERTKVTVIMRRTDSTPMLRANIRVSCFYPLGSASNQHEVPFKTAYNKRFTIWAVKETYEIGRAHV